MQPSLMSQLTQSMAQGGSPMNVQTPGSPMYQPSLTPQTPSPMPDKSPTTAMHLGALHRYFEKNNIPKPSQLQSGNIAPAGQVTLPPVQDVNPNQSGTQIPTSEAELIIKALSKRLEHHSKTAEKIVGSMLPKEEVQG